MSIFAEVGGSFQQIGGSCPEGWVVMQSERPTPEHIASADGQWVIDHDDILRQAFKVERTDAVQAITVTTKAGNTFDGDEISQGRMARAILVLPDGQTVRWILHDNTEIDATAAELREALALAGAEQARLWVMDKTTQIDQ